ncbi:MAG: hypothetical protein ACRDVZ_12010, partial [Jiangellaceae bacterium]
MFLASFSMPLFFPDAGQRVGGAPFRTDQEYDCVGAGAGGGAPVRVGDEGPEAGEGGSSTGASVDVHAFEVVDRPGSLA